MSNKFLTFVFVILIIFFIGEISYLFFFSKKTPNITNQNQNTTFTKQPGEKDKQAQAIDNNIFDSLSKLKQGVLKSSTLKNHYEGIIMDKDNKYDNISANYSLRIRLVGSNNASNIFTYSLDEVRQKISVYKSTEKGKDPGRVTIDDIKVGDSVSIDEELNLLENDLNLFLLSVKIIINK